VNSFLVALPVLMLMIGLFMYFNGERAQNNGVPILSELVKREGQFKSLSQVSGIGKSRFYLWYTIDGNAKGARVSEAQQQQLGVLKTGDHLTLELAPTVAGSNTLWAYRITHGESELVTPSITSGN